MYSPQPASDHTQDRGCCARPAHKNASPKVARLPLHKTNPTHKSKRTHRDTYRSRTRVRTAVGRLGHSRHRSAHGAVLVLFVNGHAQRARIVNHLHPLRVVVSLLPPLRDLPHPLTASLSITCNAAISHEWIKAPNGSYCIISIL